MVFQVSWAVCKSMINAIYRAIFSLLIKAVALILSVLCCLLFFVVFLVTSSLLLYYLAVGLVSVALYLGLLLLRDYRKVLGLDWLKPAEPIKLETPEVSLKICLCYAQGATYERIKEDFNLKDNTQVLRKLREGLKILLKSYSATHGLNSVTDSKKLKE